MFIETDFMYNGIKSKDMGVYLVHIENGMLEVPTLKQQIIEEKQDKKDIPIFYGINKETLSFQIAITKLDDYKHDNKFTYTERVKILKWLCKGEYKEFVSEDNNFIVYYLLFEEVKRYDNYLNQGYIVLNCRLNAPYGFSRVLENYYDLSKNNTTKILKLENKSNVIDKYYPEIEFIVIEGTSVTFKNYTNRGKTFTINNLKVGETVYINMDTGRIKSNLNLYHLDDCNKQWLSLVYGVNRVEVTGKIKLKIRTQFPMLL